MAHCNSQICLETRRMGFCTCACAPCGERTSERTTLDTQREKRAIPEGRVSAQDAKLTEVTGVSYHQRMEEVRYTSRASQDPLGKAFAELWASMSQLEESMLGTHPFRADKDVAILTAGELREVRQRCCKVVLADAMYLLERIKETPR